MADRGAQAGAAIAAAAAAHPRGSSGYNGGPPASAQVPVTHLGGGHAVASLPVAAAGDPEKDATIAELRETIEILELKIKKLEQLVRLKDSRIQTLTQRLQGGGAPPAGPGGFA
jgi:hypothetical protein